MLDFVKRLFEERSNLQFKIDKAKKALESDLYHFDKAEWDMLSEQLIAMDKYLYWLNQRISYEESK